MDLLSPRPFWPVRDGLPATFWPAERDATCDVAVIGAGITGAMIAHALTTAGLEVIVLDGRNVAHGSTAGNTGLLLYELDVPMTRLARRIGASEAQRAFVRCRDAIARVEALVRATRIECGFARKQSIYLAASQAHVGWLRREFEARREAGFDVAWWPRARVRAESTLPQAAALVTKEAAQLDAYRLTYGLLRAAVTGGARVHERTQVTRRIQRPKARRVELETSRGVRVRAREVVMATGYDAEKFLPDDFAVLRSTFALATEPLGDFEGWPAERASGPALLWDTGNPYLYLRTTQDGRAIIGGYDEAFDDPRARDARLAGKRGALVRRLREFFPRMKFEVAAEWAGTFGTTRDGLPFIGRHPRLPRTWFALGFGGNGTTFSYVAAEMIRAEMMGERDPDAKLFGFERSGVGRGAKAC